MGAQGLLHTEFVSSANLSEAASWQGAIWSLY